MKRKLAWVTSDQDGNIQSVKYAKRKPRTKKRLFITGDPKRVRSSLSDAIDGFFMADNGIKEAYANALKMPDSAGKRTLVKDLQTVKSNNEKAYRKAKQLMALVRSA
jgi:hypothetical protein